MAERLFIVIKTNPGRAQRYTEVYLTGRYGKIPNDRYQSFPRHQIANAIEYIEKLEAEGHEIDPQSQTTWDNMYGAHHGLI